MSRRIVVIGHGMVGSRFICDLLARDPQARITVLGAEGYAPYNRVLLSDVVAGKIELAGLELESAHGPGLLVRTGSEALAIDRAGRTVVTADGAYPYDTLVLATGARAGIPAGLDGDCLPPGVHALRTLDDAREIVAATANAQRAVIVGGGVLGVEIATGLAGRGLSVDLVYPGAGVMTRQLGTEAAAVADAALRGQGIRTWPGSETRHIEANGKGVEVGLNRGGDLTGHRLAADLVVLACGTLANTSLAQSAGLSTDRGIVVGPDLASMDDRSIYAIGDCAQPPEGSTGLVAQGWDQARRLATALTSSAHQHAQRGDAGPGPTRPSLAVRLGLGLVSRPVPDATGEPAPAEVAGTDIVRAKTAGISIVTMGVCGSGHHADDLRSVRLADPIAGRYVEVVVSGERLVGATCIGAPELAADLTASYTRRTPVPRDPAHLLVQPVAAAAVASSPEHMPDSATVCTCNSVSKADIVTCWHQGARTQEQIARATRASTGCGGCTAAVCGIADWLAAGAPENLADETRPQHRRHTRETARR
ncbi:MAG: FAD-dependent oxidoreductase [Beutenbergiaceae bacterium]